MRNSSGMRILTAGDVWSVLPSFTLLAFNAPPRRPGTRAPAGRLRGAPAAPVGPGGPEPEQGGDGGGPDAPADGADRRGERAAEPGGEPPGGAGPAPPHAGRRGPLPGRPRRIPQPAL